MKKRKNEKTKVALTSTFKRFALTSTLTLAAQTSMRTNVDFNVGRTNVVAALTSIALTSMRTNVDAQKRRVALSSVAKKRGPPLDFLTTPSSPLKRIWSKLLYFQLMCIYVLNRVLLTLSLHLT